MNGESPDCGGLPDIVYLCGPQVGGELRHSLRSLVNLPHRRVWIVGHIPGWVTNVGMVPVAQERSRYLNVQANVAAACAHREVSESLVLFNDDFFVVQPITRVSVLHRGPFKHLVRSYGHRRDQYAERIKQTGRLLGEQANAYDSIHTPLPAVKSDLAAVITDIPKGVLWRSVYANRCNLGGVAHPDVKVAGKRGWPDGPFVSTSDKSFRREEPGRRLRAMFPDPCRYEVARDV